MAPRLVEYEFKVDADSSRERLDVFLSVQQTEISRSRLKKLIVEGRVTVNGVKQRTGYKVRAGDRITVQVPAPVALDTAPEDIPLDIIFEDEYFIVLNKPVGMVVHPAPGHSAGTLVNALLHHCNDLSGIGGVERPGIVHRLDKDTSGLMMVAKTHAAHLNLSAQIKDRQVTKGYLALVSGMMERESGLIDAPVARDPRNRKKMAVVVGGREARTRYRVVEAMDGWSLLELYLETGRTHQIRVHLTYLGHPLYGDGVYGRANKSLDRHFLHAHHLGFRHPSTGEEIEFRSALPAELALVVDGLRPADAKM